MSTRLSPDKIRALGFEWPGSTVLADKAVAVGNDIDLQATLVRIERDLVLHKRDYDAMHEIKRNWPGPWEEITDRREETTDAYLSHDQAVRHLRAIIAAVSAGGS